MAVDTSSENDSRLIDIGRKDAANALKIRKQTMNPKKLALIVSICVAIMWVLNPSLDSHRPVAAKHIRDYLFEHYDKWYVPNAAIDNCAQLFVEQLERESYIIFSVTRLRKSMNFLGMDVSIDKLTSIGFLGMVF